jgi:hypothetical protein
MALKPNGPRPQAKLDLSFSDSSILTSSDNIHRTGSQSGSHGDLALPPPQSFYRSDSQSLNTTSQTSFTPPSPQEPLRYIGPVVTLRKPVPNRKGGGTSTLGSKYIHSGTIDMTGPPPFGADIVLDENGATIHPDETYSPEVRPMNPGRPSLSINNDTFQKSKKLTNMPDSVRGIRDVIDKLYIGDAPGTSWPSDTRISRSSPKPSSDNTASIGNPAFDNAASQPGDPWSAQETSIAGMDAHSHNAIASPTQKKEFSDEVLEVTSRLGEGAGGAVHEVRDKRDGAVYARKTITTRDSTSIRQVLRELHIITGTRHRNIVLCYGVYMSPSSSEVRIIMEYCDGRSLESVGKKLKEVGAIMGEKTAGRIAEGVSHSLLSSSFFLSVDSN